MSRFTNDVRTDSTTMSVNQTRPQPPADATADMSPYGKRADLIVHEQDPFNAETSLAALAESPLTATDAFYVRGHGAVPEIDSAAWRLQVHGLVERELDLSLVTLREAFREREVTATLQCAGNRRTRRPGRWRERSLYKEPSRCSSIFIKSRS